MGDVREEGEIWLMKHLISFRGVLYFLERAVFVIGCLGRNSIDPICINFSQSHRFHSNPDTNNGGVIETKKKREEQWRNKKETRNLDSNSLTNKSLFMSHVISQTVLGNCRIALSPQIN